MLLLFFKKLVIRYIFYENIKEIIVESEDVLGSLYYNSNGISREWLVKTIKYQKYDKYKINVNLVYPDGSKKSLRLPYGSNLFKSNEYLNLLNEDSNKKIGWYKEKTFFDHFLGILPKKDITLYGMYLDGLDETFLNKHQFYYESKYYIKEIYKTKLKVYSIDTLEEMISIFLYDVKWSSFFLY